MCVSKPIDTTKLWVAARLPHGIPDLRRRLEVKANVVSFTISSSLPSLIAILLCLVDLLHFENGERFC
jgi:hypothetical protein